MENLKASRVRPNLSRPYSQEKKKCESRRLLSPLCSGTMPRKNLRHHTRQSPQAKVPQLVAGSGLPPPTYPPPGASTETLVSPLAFNLAKVDLPNQPLW